MTRWQRRARAILGVFAVAFALIVLVAVRRRAPTPALAPVARTDAGAVVETTGGRAERFRLSRQDVHVEYDKQLTYADGSSKMMGVKIVTVRGGRSFTVTGKEGRVGKDEATIELNGDVRLVSSDGMTAKTEHATYSASDGFVRAPGSVDFANGRMTASGVGMTYDKELDVLSVLEQAVVHITHDGPGAGAADVTSGSAVFARRDKIVRFSRGVKMQRVREIVEASTATAYMTADENHIETVELRENSRITSSNPGVGGLQALTGRDMNLKYRADGETLEHAQIVGEGVIQVAGAAGTPGRQITASTIDVALAPDGSTPTALVGRDNVQLTLPAEAAVPARTIRSTTVEAKGEAGRGLTRAEFAGNVLYRERGAGVDRGCSAAMLDVSLKPGMSAIEDARFARGVRFVDGKMTAVAAAARYDPDNGVVELNGSEAGAPAPRVVNDQIAVDATRVEVTLAGPKMKGAGRVKSVVQAPKPQANGKSDMKMPSLLKQDQPVNVTAAALDYDGAISKATYTGGAQLWQDETTIKAGSIVLDGKTGDLSASGSVTTTTMLDQVDKNKQKERVRSMATAQTFKYEDSIRRATYAENAHMSGPQGDMTAATIELYLKPSGDELERAEAYESVALRAEDRKITGLRLTYTTADQRYVVTGTPVTVLDECDRETKGKTLTYLKTADTIVVDGNEQTRTQTKGTSNKCG